MATFSLLSDNHWNSSRHTYMNPQTKVHYFAKLEIKNVIRRHQIPQARAGREVEEKAEKEEKEEEEKEEDK